MTPEHRLYSYVQVFNNHKQIYSDHIDVLFKRHMECTNRDKGIMQLKTDIDDITMSDVYILIQKIKNIPILPRLFSLMLKLLFRINRIFKSL